MAVPNPAIGIDDVEFLGESAGDKLVQHLDDWVATSLVAISAMRIAGVAVVAIDELLGEPDVIGDSVASSAGPSGGGGEHPEPATSEDRRRRFLQRHRHRADLNRGGRDAGTGSKLLSLRAGDPQTADFWPSPVTPGGQAGRGIGSRGARKACSRCAGGQGSRRLPRTGPRSSEPSATPGPGTHRRAPLHSAAA